VFVLPGSFFSESLTTEECHNYFNYLALAVKTAPPAPPQESKTTQLSLVTHSFFRVFFQKYFPVLCRLGLWGERSGSRSVKIAVFRVNLVVKKVEKNKFFLSKTVTIFSLFFPEKTRELM
jgi:hypothetical protein